MILNNKLLIAMFILIIIFIIFKLFLKWIKNKKSHFCQIRNNFIAGIVALIPIGVTLYLTLFIIKLSTKLIPEEINPNSYLPFDIPGLEILIALVIITFVRFISLSFLGKKFLKYLTAY